MPAAASFLCGLVFGFGLLISGMLEPPKVLGFLDVLGRWDPTLAFVMAGALAVSGAGYALARRFPTPTFADRQQWPTGTNIDRRLVIGSVLFGAGWGLAGLCPGPALENLATLSPKVVAFVLAMIAGMGVHGWWQSRAPFRATAAEAAPASPDG
jgi:uncharacterized protein